MTSQVDNMSFYFDREKTKVLINIYEKYPDIYNVHRDIYKNKVNRQMKLTQILNEFKLYFPEANVTLADIKKKINGLRSQYFNELGKIAKSKTSGAGADDVYKPTWWCFDSLIFLQSSAVTRESTSNFDIEAAATQTKSLSNTEGLSVEIFDGTIEELETLDVTIESPLASPTMPVGSRPAKAQLGSKGKKNKPNQPMTDSAMNLLKEATSALRDQTETQPVTQHDHISAFAEMIESEMRRIKDTGILNGLKRNMTQLLFDALDEDLRRENNL